MPAPTQRLPAAAVLGLATHTIEALVRTTYPARSRESDLAARVLNMRLQQVAAGERDFMVTVVTSRSGQAFVGFSGTHRELGARLEAQLVRLGEEVGDAVVAKARLTPQEAGWARKTRLYVSRWSREYEWLGNYIVLGEWKYHHLGPAGQAVLFRGTPGSASGGRPLTAEDKAELDRERAIRKAGLDAGEAAKAASRRLLETAPRSARFQTEQTAHQQAISASVQTMAAQQHDKVLAAGNIDPARKIGVIHGFNWNCAEPKALFDAVAHGDGIQGMTTFWFGLPAKVAQHQFLDTTPDKGARDLVICRPCERCSEFETMIMAAVSRLEERVRRAGLPELDAVRRLAVSLEAPW